MTDILMCGENPIGQVSEYIAGETIKSDSIAPVESLVSLHAYAKDDLLVYNGELYIATSAIAVGDTITSKIERTSTTSYVNPTRMNHIEDGIEAVDGKTANDIPYSSGVSVKDKLDWVLVASNITSDTPSIDVSAYSELYIIPKMAGFARIAPLYCVKISNNFNMGNSYREGTTYAIDYMISIVSNAFTITYNLSGWTSVAFDIYGKK